MNEDSTIVSAIIRTAFFPVINATIPNPSDPNMNVPRRPIAIPKPVILKPTPKDQSSVGYLSYLPLLKINDVATIVAATTKIVAAPVKMARAPIPLIAIVPNITATVPNAINDNPTPKDHFQSGYLPSL